jgi:hypothetical protein
MARGEIVALRANIKGAFRGQYQLSAESPTLLLKIRDTPLLPVGLEKDLGRADDPLPVKSL